MNEDFFSSDEVIKRTSTALNPKVVVLSILRAKGMKQTDLAREVGITKQALWNYLSGEWAVPVSMKIKIAKVLGVDSSAIWEFPEVNP